MTAKEIKERLELSGLRTNGVYSSIVEIVEESIETVKLFGFEKWESETSLGKKAKNIVKEMAGV